MSLSVVVSLDQACFRGAVALVSRQSCNSISIEVKQSGKPILERKEMEA